MKGTDLIASLEPGRAYRVTYQCKGLGYKVDPSCDEFVYRGGPDAVGMHEFTPVGGGPSCHLFPDEIKNAY